MRNLWLCGLLLIIWSMFSCSSEQETTPDRLIPVEKMGLIMADVHIAEASLISMTAAERDTFSKLYYGHIFRIHDVVEEDFYTSTEYYAKSPERLQKMYDLTRKRVKELKAKNKGN